MVEKDFLPQNEYFAYGRFPDSERVLGIGPRKEKRNTIFIRSIGDETDKKIGHYYIAELLVDNKEPEGKIVFERNVKGQPFKTEQELIDYLAKKFSISYMRDVRNPAVSTG